jgi:hypothetical protein
MAKAPNLPTYLNSVRINKRASIDATDAHDSIQENEPFTYSFLGQTTGSNEVDNEESEKNQIIRKLTQQFENSLIGSVQ